MKVFSSLLFLSLFLTACDVSQLNNPYAENDEQLNVLYSSFSERPKHLDPAVSYSSNEYAFIAQIYEPPYQYHYLKRPYQLVPLSATKLPSVHYLNAAGEVLPSDAEEKDIAFSDYIIDIQQGVKYQPHPALAKDKDGGFAYHQLSEQVLADIHNLNDFAETGTRELIAEDYVYQIKRLAHPKIHSPIAEVMKHHIEGFAEFSKQVKTQPKTVIKDIAMGGVQALSPYRYKIRIKGKYPQFRFWLAMPFFAPMPWEADVFYAQQGLIERNITLDWYPIGTGAYLLSENNPNRRMVLSKNPNFHGEKYPKEGEQGDAEQGLLKDAGKGLPFIDKVVYILEKETIPYWNKFLQGYYDASGIASDSFDQAVQFSSDGDAKLTGTMLEKEIRLQTSVATSIYYLGFNMLDNVVGGNTEKNRKLRQALSIAIDYEEYISIFMNGRGIAAQGILPLGIYGFSEGKEGINPYVYDKNRKRKAINEAQELLKQAGYKDGIDPATGEALTLYFDTASSSVDDRPRMNWFRKQFEKLGIKLVIRGTDYNRFQEKMRNGNAQIFIWGWNADYPDPENFFFLLYGANAKVKHGGENAVNYNNPEFNALFEKMRNMDNGEQRYQIIQKMQEIVRRDAPWVFGLHPKDFVLSHSWYQNLKPNLMANNTLKYKRIDSEMREKKREQWNQAVFFPLLIVVVILALLFVPAIRAYKKRLTATLSE
ncbi:MAG: peptide ABC transporter substrate-binding protein [Methylococcaceae bacterium]|nr:peptide ABC transporter substrate-binding protein [Methylococcaceae bacterium]